MKEIHLINYYYVYTFSPFRGINIHENNLKHKSLFFKIQPILEVKFLNFSRQILKFHREKYAQKKSLVVFNKNFKKNKKLVITY